MNADLDEILRELRPPDVERVDQIFPPEFRAHLRRSITNRDPRRRSSRPRAVLVSAVAAAAATIVIMFGLVGANGHGTPAAAAVRFKNANNGEIIAYVVNPFAAARQLRAEFTKRGFDITLSLVPASPSIVGTVVFGDGDGTNNGQIRALQGGRCVTGGGGCPIGLVIPAGFHGRADIAIGRKARNGETYASTTSAFAPGEVLHCTNLSGARVSAAVPVFASKHLRVTDWRETETNKTLSEAPLAQYVRDVDPITDGTIRVWTGRQPANTTASVTEKATLDRGC